MNLVIYSIIASLVGVGSILLNIFSLKKLIKANGEFKIYREKVSDHWAKAQKIEKEKQEIREKHNEKENDIVNGSVGESGIMPVSTSERHTHDPWEPCRKGCPAYSRKD